MTQAKAYAAASAATAAGAAAYTVAVADADAMDAAVHATYVAHVVATRIIAANTAHFEQVRIFAAEV